MNWEDGVLLSDNGSIAERATYKKGVVTIGRFRRVRDADGGEPVWKLDHLFTMSATATAATTALVTDHLLRGQSFGSEVALERMRQNLAFPKEEHGLPDGTGAAAYRTYEEIARNACDRAAREGRLTLAHILEEEAAEVLATVDPAKLREELVQLSAVCCRWVEDIDGRALRAVPNPAPAETEAA